MPRKALGDRPMTAAERQRRRREAPNRIIVADGGAWRLSERRFGQLVAAIHAGRDYDLDALGIFLGVTVDPKTLRDAGE